MGRAGTSIGAKRRASISLISDSGSDSDCDPPRNFKHRVKEMEDEDHPTEHSRVGRGSLPSTETDSQDDISGRILNDARIGASCNENEPGAFSTSNEQHLKSQKVQGSVEEEEIIATKSEFESVTARYGAGDTDVTFYLPSADDRLLVKLRYEDEKSGEDIARELRTYGGKFQKMWAKETRRSLTKIKDKFLGWKDENIHRPALAGRIESMSIDDLLVAIKRDPADPEDLVTWSTLADGVDHTSIVKTISERVQRRSEGMSLPPSRQAAKRGTPQFSTQTDTRVRAWEKENFRPTQKSQIAELMQRPEARQADYDEIAAATPLNSTRLRDAVNKAEASITLRCSQCPKTFDDNEPKFDATTGEYLRRGLRCPSGHKSTAHYPIDGRSSSDLYRLTRRKNEVVHRPKLPDYVRGPADGSEARVSVKCTNITCQHIFDDKVPKFAAEEGWYLMKKKICPKCKKEVTPPRADGKKSVVYRMYVERRR